METLKIVSLVFTLLAVLTPYILRQIQKRDLLNKSDKLIKLIKTKDELVKLKTEKQDILNQESQDRNNSLLIQKLNERIEDIDDRIYSEEKRIKLASYIIFITIEILIGFILVSMYLINEDPNPKETGNFLKEIREGFLANPFIVIATLLFITIVSYTAIQKKKKKIKILIKNKVWYNLVMFGSFNVILAALLLLLISFLYLVDDYTNWF